MCPATGTAMATHRTARSVAELCASKAGNATGRLPSVQHSRGISVTDSPPLSDDGRALRRIVSVYLLLTTIPQLVKRLELGRMYDAQVHTIEVPDPPLVRALALMLAAVFVLTCVATTGHHMRRVVKRPPFLAIVLCLILIFPAVNRNFGGVPWQGVAVNAFLYLALAGLRPRVSDLRVFAHLAAVLAAGSILFGVLNESAWRAGSLEDAQSKAIVGHGILAGPYPSSNNLGMGMALAIPFVFLVSSRSLRRTELVLLVAALVLSASRSSIIAVGVACLGIVVLRGFSSMRERAVIYWLGVGILCSVAALLPWMINSPGAFTSRGGIWMASRAVVAASPILGYGPDAYTPGGPVAAALGHVAPAGHNAILHYWVVGGILASAAMVIVMVVAARGAWTGSSRCLVLPAFVFVLLTLAADEMPIRPEQAIGQCWIALPVLALLVSSPVGRSWRSDELVLGIGTRPHREVSRPLDATTNC